MSVIVKKSNSNNVVAFDKTKLESAFDEYQNQGFHILPLDDDNICHKSKEQQEAYTNPIPKDFEGKGVGIHLEKSNLVGIDVDCDEVVPFLETFLPQTATTCRKSKATSWKFFKLDGGIDKNIRFPNCDNEGKATQELGGVKFKAVTPLPPTIHHKSKESIVWKFSELATITAKKLIETVTRCFGMALIALRWPEAANRHEAGLALSGSLAHAGWSVEDAKKAIKALAKSVGDNKVEDRLKELQSSYEAHKASQKATGLPSLVFHLTTSSKEQEYLKKTLNAWLRGNPYPDKEEVKNSKFSKPLIGYAHTIEELTHLPIPKMEYMVYNWLPTKGIIHVIAGKSTGKTWFALELGLSLAKGKNFFAWAVPKPRRVLIIDGEMQESELISRYIQLNGEEKFPDNLNIISCIELLSNGDVISLHDTESQQWINECLASLSELGRNPDLIILDNFSSMTRDIDDNSNSDQSPYLDWLLKLRSLGYSVLIIDHTGKEEGKGARGASRKVERTDTRIELVNRKVEGEKYAHFEIRFLPTRGITPDPHKLDVRLVDTDKPIPVSTHIEPNTYFLRWETDTPKMEIPLYIRCLIAIYKHQPNTQKELAKIIGCKPPNLTAPIKKAINDGYLTDKTTLALTNDGIAHIQPELKALIEFESDV